MRESVKSVATTSMAGLLVGLLAVGCGNSKVPGSDEGTDAGDASAADGATVVEDDSSGDDGSDGGDTGFIEPEKDTGTPPADVGDGTVPVPEIWWLKRGAEKWETFDMPSRRSRNAPTAEIVAAFDIEHSNNAFVITTNGVHTLRLEPPEWTEAVPISEMASTLSGVNIVAAYSDPDDSPDDAVTLVATSSSSPGLWKGKYDFGAESFSGFESAESLEWSSGSAPMPGAVIAAWRDNDNSRDWMDGKAPCDNAPDEEFDAYIGYLTAGSVYFNDAWYCTDHFASFPLGQSPLAKPGFPGTDRIGAAFWHGGAMFLMSKN